MPETAEKVVRFATCNLRYCTDAAPPSACPSRRLPTGTLWLYRRSTGTPGTHHRVLEVHLHSLRVREPSLVQDLQGWLQRVRGFARAAVALLFLPSRARKPFG